jgi:acetyl-CoA/propionyl-CoA carboxylase biotin carboxyl carrier protein
MTYRTPSGPGVRVDSGVEEGDVISGSFDSMLAKLIVTGADRRQALARARRALREFDVVGMPTALTFHRVVVEDPAFAPADDEPFSVHTRWIETEFDNTIEAYSGPTAEGDEEAAERTDMVVEVDGRRLSVSLPGGLSLGGPAGGERTRAPRRTARASGGQAASGDSVTAPMQGTVVKVVVSEGDQVSEGDTVVVIEAMKMEQPIKAHKAGTVGSLKAEVGQTVTNGAVICDVTD